MQLESEFKFNINQKIIPGMVAAGRFNKNATFLVAATTGGKIILTNLWQTSTGTERESSNILNINQDILCLTTGHFKNITEDRDLVFVGTGSNLLVYDVENNSDVFYKDIPDGVSCCTVGRLGNNDEDVVVVGGNCSLAVFNSKGEELFWSVTGDNVTSLSIVDLQGKGISDLIVGSEDFEMRIFRHDDIVNEITETEVVTNLCSLGGSLFSYGLANGTVGVYEGLNRLWRIKSKSIPIGMVGYDIDGDGEVEVITGWNNGKLDARRLLRGDVMAKDSLNSPIAGVLTVLHPQYNNKLLMVCTNEGEIRIYKPSLATESGVLGMPIEQDQLIELNLTKKNLMCDIQNFQNLKVTSQEPNPDHSFIIPPDTDVDFSMTISKEKQKPGILLNVTTNNEVIIRSLLIFAEGIFDGECHVVHPPANKLSSSLSVSIYPPKDISVSLHTKVLTGHKNSTQFHVFEVMKVLPRFSMYKLVESEEPFKRPVGFVSFTVQERLQRFALWINQNFLLDKEYQIPSKEQSEMMIKFVGLRQNVPLEIHISTRNNQVTVFTDSMELASQIVQSLTEYLNITELASDCHFPLEFELLSEVISKIDGIQNGLQRITVDQADNSNLITNLIVRAEDCRLMKNMSGVKKYYSELMNLNRDLVGRFKIRMKNHQELMSLLKFVNQFIQRGSNLRMGRYRTQLVAQCRQAIQENKLFILEKLIKSGPE